MSYIPTNIYKEEIVVKKSRFIGIGLPIESVDDCRKKLKELKLEYPDSRHICYGFQWGKKSTHQGMSDDGEPSGTAGRPILEVIKGSGYENILVAVVRYFGGTKLGTGGLVKAYTEVTKKIIENIEVEEFVELLEKLIKIPYNLFDRFKIILDENLGIIDSCNYASNIEVTFKIPKENVKKFNTCLLDLSNGELTIS